MQRIFSITEVEIDDSSPIARLTYIGDFYWQKSAQAIRDYHYPDCRITTRYVSEDHARYNCEDTLAMPIVSYYD